MKTLYTYKFQKNFNLQKRLIEKESALKFKKEIFDLISNYRAELLQASYCSENYYHKLPSQDERLNEAIVDIILNANLTENRCGDNYNHLLYSISAITNDDAIITTVQNFGNRQYIKIEMKYSN